MTNRKIIFIEYYSPWLCGGYDTKILNNNNKLFRAVGFVMRESECEIVIALGESRGQYLHQVSIPRGCIKGTPCELESPLQHPELDYDNEF